MIESLQKKERITDTITRWCEFTKTLPLLRTGDIPNLVRSIIDEFYHITLCCGHKVTSMDEGVHIAWMESCGETQGEISGSYCKDCAESYLKDKRMGAWRVKE